MLKHASYINSKNYEYKNEDLLLGMRKCFGDLNAMFSLLSNNSKNKIDLNKAIDRRSIKNFVLEVLNFNSILEEMVIRIAKRYTSKTRIKQMAMAEVILFIKEKSSSRKNKDLVFDSFVSLRLMRNKIAHTIEPEKQIKDFLKSNSKESFLSLKKELNRDVKFITTEYERVLKNKFIVPEKDENIVAKENPFNLKF